MADKRSPIRECETCGRTLTKHTPAHARTCMFCPASGYKPRVLYLGGGLEFQDLMDEWESLDLSVLPLLVATEPGHYSLMLPIGENTTQDELRDAIPHVCRWRDRLLEVQGPWMGGGDTRFYFELASRHPGQLSYAELANCINTRVAEDLLGHVAYQARAAAGNRAEDRRSSQFSLDSAREWLRLARLSVAGREEWLSIGLQRIGEGLPPFDAKSAPGVPVSREQARVAIKWWRRQPQRRALPSDN